MSEEEKQKYIRVFDIEQANKRYGEGYRVHSSIVRVFQEDLSGCIISDISYLMSLTSESKYDNISNLLDVSPEQVDEYLAKGYIVTDSWSKVVRMVKKNAVSDREVQEG